MSNPCHYHCCLHPTNNKYRVDLRGILYTQQTFLSYFFARMTKQYNRRDISGLPDNFNDKILGQVKDHYMIFKDVETVWKCHVAGPI